MLFSLAHVEKKKAAERKKKKAARGLWYCQEHINVLPGKMQPSYDGCPCVPRPHGRSKVTAGSKVIDSSITPRVYVMIYANVAKILQGFGATSDNSLFASIEFQWRLRTLCAY